MKSLNNYLKDNMNVNLEINDSLDLHFYAEFVLRDSMRYTINKIDERYGSYIGQKELILKIAKDIYVRTNNIVKDNKSIFIYTKDDLKEYSNIFFNELKIYLHKKTTLRVGDVSKFDKTTKLFNKVIITLSDEDSKTLSEICSALMHEILHAYNDYMDNLTNAKTTLSDLTKIGTSYSKTHVDYTEDSKATGESICKEILCDIRKFEQNAYFSELTTTLEVNKFNINDFNNTIDAYKCAKKLFKETGVWKRYISCIIGLNYVKTYKSFKNDFVKTYNEINNVNWSFEKIYKKLYGILKYIIERFETTISKLFCNYYQQQLNEHLLKEIEGTTAHGIYGRKLFVEYMELINEYDNSNLTLI